LEREDLIERLVLEHAAKSGGEFQGPLERSTKLLCIGLDSLGFVTLTVDLERKLGIDPFARADEIIYPETFGELIDLYAGSDAA